IKAALPAGPYCIFIDVLYKGHPTVSTDPALIGAAYCSSRQSDIVSLDHGSFHGFGNTVHDPMQLSKLLLVQANAALAPFGPVFNLIDVALTLFNAVKAIPMGSPIWIRARSPRFYL